MTHIYHDTPLNRTPLYSLHERLNAKIVNFAHYQMPVYYPTGIIKEHLHCRKACGVFDISHMGQIILKGSANIAQTLETLIPGNIKTLAIGAIRYSVLLNDKGGIIDDLMITKHAENSYQIVVNANRKHIDFDVIHKTCQKVPNLQCCLLKNMALIALQGPQSVTILKTLLKECEYIKFMHARICSYQAHNIIVSRSGYSGQDGFEISLPSHLAIDFVNELLKNPACLPIGLGARDSLRLEAGLCLYGNELTEDISPIEAQLQWIIPKRRRQEANFPGSTRILRELNTHPSKRRVGILPQGRSSAYNDAIILNANNEKCGYVTSSGFSPNLQKPICMGYVDNDVTPQHTIKLKQKQRLVTAQIVDLPFVPHSYATS